MSIDITALFGCVDDFGKLYESAQKSQSLPSSKQSNRQGYLSLSEMLLIEIYFHLSAYKDFKYYYLYGIGVEHRDKFGKIPCYQGFVSLKKSLFVPLTILLNTLKGQETGIYFADSPSLKVCHNKRISRPKTFDGLATRGKSTLWWFYGLKLHLILNHQGDIMAVKITPGNTDDRKALKSMCNSLKGKCYADKGYLGKKIFQTLWEKGLPLITGIRKNMKQHLMPYKEICY